ncbi:MAG: corrinoid protein [Actinomycetota bacterium]|nr:corrinoid protein [Actinomycetota bacterium]
MDWEAELSRAVSEGDEIKAVEVAGRALDAGAKAEEVLEKGAVAGIKEAGRLWQDGDFFLPDVILATEAYKEVMTILEPRLSPGEISYKGKVIIGSVEGDAHDIGKNIVIALLRCSSYEVMDLGIDVPLGEFVNKAKELKPDVVGMGAYMTTTMRGMEEVLRMLEEEGLRDGVKVIIGGAAVTRDYAERIGADGYGDNAAETVEMVEGLLGVS